MIKFGFSKGAWRRASDEGRLVKDMGRVRGSHRWPQIEPGKRFFNLTVLSVAPPEQGSCVAWKCKCDCGNETIAMSSDLALGRKKSCGCRKLRHTNSHWKWSGFGEISLTFWSKILSRNGKNASDVGITIEQAWDLFLKQERRCALSGVLIKFGIGRSDETTASLDRIDSNHGYLIDNVQWVHKWVNIMKLDHTKQEFFNWVKLIYEHNRLNS